MPFKQMTSDGLLTAVTKVLSDRTYREKADKVGDLLTDQIAPPLESAVWWIEFLLRHPDYRLASPVHRMSWVQLNQIDVAAVLLLACAIAITVCFYAVKGCVSICCKAGKAKTD